MAKSPKNDTVGDTKSPALRQNAESLFSGPDQAARISADAAPKPTPISKLSSMAAGIKNQSETTSPPGTCVQTLWFSFFFDGTGNNLDADVGTLKHSSVARLFRSMPDNDKVNGSYAFYIPGVATYFKEVGDDGGTLLGLGSGDMGKERLAWALKQFDDTMKFHIARANNPANAIVEINMAAFGFSRGAALARAFIHQFVEDRCKQDQKDNWRLMPQGYKLRVRFMGLFDSVASVGAPMATNNTSSVGAVIDSISYKVKARLNDSDYAETRPERIAFGKNAKAGADPAPGRYNGHSSWGNDMLIPIMVEEVRHFVAAHEIRNSFPLESISVLEKGRIQKPDHFFETVYPGVHSDVGGSYRPGEGGKSDQSAQKLGLIALGDMYKLALAKGVPLLPKTAWTNENKKDFDIDLDLLRTYAYYLSKVVAQPTLGALFNANMGLYYAWRFRAIHRKQQGDHVEADHMKKNDATFNSDLNALDKEIKALELQNNMAIGSLNHAEQQRTSYINSQYGNPKVMASLGSYDEKIAAARKVQVETQDKLLRAKAKRDALPRAGQASRVAMYDQQLLADARAIYDVYNYRFNRDKPDPAIRNDLRPHYKLMMAAYENEYDPDKKGLTGLKDDTIIAFFDNYVHDSLAGFAKDATLPSDPRVIYLGGNEKYQYAKVTHAEEVDIA